MGGTVWLLSWMGTKYADASESRSCMDEMQLVLLILGPLTPSLAELQCLRSTVPRIVQPEGRAGVGEPIPPDKDDLLLFSVANKECFTPDRHSTDESQQLLIDSFARSFRPAALRPGESTQIKGNARTARRRTVPATISHISQALRHLARTMLSRLLLQCLGIAVIGLLFLFLRRTGRRGRNLPPGPPTLPVIGNLHQLPKSGAHFKFTEWAHQYGGMFSLKMGSATAIVLTDRSLVKNLVDKRSAIYSDRPSSYVSHDLITRGDHLLVMNYGDRWRSFRKLIHHYFLEIRCEKEHITVQQAEAVQMLRDFCVAPGELMKHPGRFSNSIIMSLLFGIRTASADVPHLVDLHKILEGWVEVMEIGATPPVDVFPILKWVPERFLGNWITRSRRVGRAMDALYGRTIARVQQRRLRAGSRGSFIDGVLDQQEKLGLSQDEVNFLGGVMMEGGTETTSSVMLTFIHAMVKFPRVQKKAQEEIDAVVGEDRSPLWSDYARLPYVSQIVKETMRWRPITPLSFPHALKNEDVVNGMTLPKGTMITINVWGLHHDPVRFPDPDVFDPDRFAGRTLLASEYANAADCEIRDHYSYGAGRRICPGIHLAERSLFIGMAKLLWGFEFSECKDAGGNAIPLDVDPKTAYREGFAVCPKPFDCEIVPRSEARRATIMREFDEAERNVFSHYE